MQQGGSQGFLSVIEQIYAEMSSLMIRNLTIAWANWISVAYLLQLMLANQPKWRVACRLG
jgi:hypothetical protein